MMDFPTLPANAFSALQDVDTTIPSGQAYKLDWEGNRAIIKQLYAHNTLPKIIEIMKSRGFKAT